MLENMTVEQLREELAKREKEIKDQEKPKLLENKDFSKVVEYCVEYIEELNVNGYADEDLRHYIYEAAMTACFGDDVWVWVRKQ